MNDAIRYTQRGLTGILMGVVWLGTSLAEDPSPYPFETVDALLEQAERDKSVESSVYTLKSMAKFAVSFQKASMTSFWKYWKGGEEEAKKNDAPFFKIDWADHYAEAVTQARKERKPMMIVLSRGTLSKPPC